MNYKFENIETKENLLNKMRHASYSNRYRQANESAFQISNREKIFK